MRVTSLRWKLKSTSGKEWYNGSFFRGIHFSRRGYYKKCRACFCTCSTVGTYFRINAVDISLGDCFHRTFIDTCTTCNTIFTNYVSHFLLFLKLEQCKSKQFFRLKKMFVFFFILSFAAITFFFFRYSYKIKANWDEVYWWSYGGFWLFRVFMLNDKGQRTSRMPIWNKYTAWTSLNYLKAILHILYKH